MKQANDGQPRCTDRVVRCVRVPVDRFFKVVKDRALQSGVETACPVTLVDD